MSELRTKIKTRLENKFFNTKVNAALKNTVDKNKQLFLTEAISIYQRTIPIYKELNIFKLETVGNNFNYDRVIEVVKFVKYIDER